MNFLNEIKKQQNLFIKHGNDLFNEKIDLLYADKKPIISVDSGATGALIFIGFILSIFYWFFFGAELFKETTLHAISPLIFSMGVSLLLMLSGFILASILKIPNYEKIQFFIKNRKKYLTKKFNDMYVSDELLSLFKQEYKINVSEKITNKMLINYAMKHNSLIEIRDVKKIVNHI